MSYRTGSRSDFEARDYAPPPRRSAYDDDYYERRSDTRSNAPRRAPVRDYEEVDVAVRERTRERTSDRTPAFLRDEPRRPEAGAMVLRQREVETVDRRRPRSPSSSPSPPPPRVRERIIERSHSLSPPRRHIHPRYVEPSHDVRVEVDTRVSERRRSPSPDREREIRIIERERERIPSPSPSPPPPPPEPPVIRGPTLEREVITHYTDVDHGVVRAKRPSPPPPPPAPERRPRTKERDTEIDITLGRRETDIDIDIHKHTRSRSRPRPRPRPRPRSSHFEEDIIIDTNNKHVEITEHKNRRRAHSLTPKPDYADEADYITGKIDSRGRMGEAWNGATKDWTIVDVPPGTERVKMDGVGGGGAEVTWQRYNGVRRAQFVPERDAVSSSSSLSEPVREREPSKTRELSVQVYNERDREVEIEETHDRRISIRDGSRPPAKAPREMWTEITKDLVVREAIDQLGYDYEETEYFFYVMQYLKYEDVLELVNVSDEIRRYRRQKARQIEYEREYRDEYRDEFERRYRIHEHSRTNPRFAKGDYEYELSYDRGPVGTYYR